MARPRTSDSGLKETKTVRLDPALIEWTEKRVAARDFGSFTHAVEKGLMLLRDLHEGRVSLVDKKGK